VPYLLTPNATPPEVGGLQRQEFEAGSGRNVIQAAAPAGNPGNLSLSSPELDISGSLVGLSGRPIENAGLAEDPCVAAWKKDASSLVAAGRGGVRSHYGTGGFSFAGPRLDAETTAPAARKMGRLALQRGALLPVAEPRLAKEGCVQRSSL
jgi:hypothetical protein